MQGLALFADEKRLPGRLDTGSFLQPYRDRPQFIAPKWMRSRQAAFQSPDVQYPTRDIHLIELQFARLGDTEAMPEHEKHEAAVAGLITASFRGGDELFPPRGW